MGDGGQRGPATVVITQRMRRGRENDVRRWQQDVDRAAGLFTGYLGNDVATSGDAADWTVIYRFDSRPHLMSWLDSPDREEIIRSGVGLFDGPASQHVLIRENDAELVTVVVSHPVDAADEGDFLSWQERVTEAERQFPGFRGSELFRPVPGVQDEWTALYRYDTDEHATAWLESPERSRLLREGRRFKDFELHRISSPFGSWFAGPDGEKGDGGPPPWKTAMSVLVGLYPTVVLLTLVISRLWKSAELWESLLVGNILSVSLLTWVVMPVVTRALGWWLVAEKDDSGMQPDGTGSDGTRSGATRLRGARLDVLGAAVSVVFLALAALVFWLCTTQIWHLP